MAERRSDVEIVRDQITREVTNDAASVASDVFRLPEPDVVRQTNQQIDARYARAFQEGDRSYLTGEAQRDPRQFLEAARRLGVVLPQDKPLEPQMPLPRPAQSAVPLTQPPQLGAPTPQPLPPAPVRASQLPAVITPPGVPAAAPPEPTVY